jgi:hypothetical protein
MQGRYSPGSLFKEFTYLTEFLSETIGFRQLDNCETAIVNSATGRFPKRILHNYMILIPGSIRGE